MTLEEAEKRTILRGVVGSTAHGLALPGTDDRDEMGICVEPIEEAMGINSSFEQLVYRTAEERTGKHDAPSEPGDLDLTIYSLRKYLRLAMGGNPTIILPLFIPTPTKMDALGIGLRELTPLIISRRAGKASLEYLRAQRYRLTGEKGQKRVNRPDLIEKFGYDTKYAMHMLRLGIQGAELMKTGRITLPMASPEREYLMGVRNGIPNLQAVLTRAGELEVELSDLLTHSPIREEPDREAVEEWMITVYERKFSAARTHKDILEDMERGIR